MKTTGILGGMSAAATALYDTQLNALVQQRLAGLHSAGIVVRSVDFAPIAALQAAGVWGAAGLASCPRGRRPCRRGVPICWSSRPTPCTRWPVRLRQPLQIPFVNIADATAAAIVAGGQRRPGLMATAYTMEQGFYLSRLAVVGLGGLDGLVTHAKGRADTHRIIYVELCRGMVLADGRTRFEAIAAGLIGRGADFLIPGCTEVGMLLDQRNVAVPVYDTVAIHCRAAFDLAMAIQVGQDHDALGNSAAG